MSFYDPALRCRPYIVERITRDKSQSGVGSVVENANVIGRYDTHGFNSVMENVVWSCEGDLIADSELPQTSEE